MQSPRRAFGKLIPIPIPSELADEPALLAHLQMSPAELNKIWWYRGRMYSQFEIAKSLIQKFFNRSNTLRFAL